MNSLQRRAAFAFCANLALCTAALAALCAGCFQNNFIPADAAHAEAIRVDTARVDSVKRWGRVKPFVGDFESGGLAVWSSHEAARADSIQVVVDPVRRGRHAAKFTVRPGDRTSNGNRAELVWDNREQPGSQSWYGWSFLVPSDYADVEPKPNLWQLMGQWHDQPDPGRGETWDDFPGHSPPISIVYSAKKGASRIELWYGTYAAGAIQKIVATAPIQKGRWNDLVFHIGWSPREDGFIEAWLNGKPFIAQGDKRHNKQHKVFGANMWNAYPHYLKIGLYRSSLITTTNSVYFDEVKIGNSYRDVAIAAHAAGSR